MGHAGGQESDAGQLFAAHHLLGPLLDLASRSSRISWKRSVMAFIASANSAISS